MSRAVGEIKAKPESFAGGVLVFHGSARDTRCNFCRARGKQSRDKIPIISINFTCCHMSRHMRDN